MIEKIRGVRNPLTIVAIFAGIAEVGAAIALPQLTPDIQSKFIWFVMLFPVLLVILFFVTLNWNPRCLYAPSDFVEEANFLATIGTSSRRTAKEIEDQEGRINDEKRPARSS